jgi:hypothetical protein
MSRMAEATIMFDFTQPDAVRSPEEIERLLAY